jgi:nicotinamidase-related amidase
MTYASRDVPFSPGRCALLVIDVQNATYNESGRTQRPYFHDQASRTVIPNIARLIAACRRTRIEVVYTVMESLTLDGRDRSLDYKLSGFNFPKGCWEAQVVDAVAPDPDEIVISKTSSSLFNSTNFDYVMRNIGIEQILVTGFLTDQCVDHTIRDGADRGYLMVCVEDGCATDSAERHRAALSLFKGYCRQMTTEAVLAALR